MLQPMEGPRGEIPGSGGSLHVVSEDLLSRPVRFARELLYFLLGIEILFFIAGVSVTIAILGDNEIGPSYNRPNRTGQELLSSGVSVIVTSSVFLLTTVLALLSLRLWRPSLLLPHFASLMAGAVACLYYVIRAVLVEGFQEDLGLKLVALAGFMICLFLLLHLCCVFFLLDLPRPQPQPQPPTSPSSLELPSTCPLTSQDLELPSCPHTSQDLELPISSHHNSLDLELPISSHHNSQHLDLPPGYDSILDDQLPAYEDSIVKKEPVLASS